MSFSTSLLVLAIQFLSAHALRITSVSAPHVVPRYSDAVLRCDFNLESDRLYMVRWHYQESEIFRFRPKDPKPIRVFSSAGINVDEKYSNATHLRLKGVNFAAAGTWVCEVVGEQPAFESDRGATVLQVVVFPKDVPSIVTDREVLESGDLIHLTCSSGPAYPEVNLTWYINGNPVPADNVEFYTVGKMPDETFTTKTGISLRVNEIHFLGGNLKVRCIASIKDIYWKTSEVTLKLRGYQKPKSSPLSNGDERRGSSGSRFLWLIGFYYYFVFVFY